MSSAVLPIMPLINGMKMAWYVPRFDPPVLPLLWGNPDGGNSLLTTVPSEPCIRGHRSTKCNHADERLMVPVRKPGRPLSACPHPASGSCACAAVTAAIPRKQKCSCGTSNDTPTDLKAEQDPASPETTPQSPSKASSTNSSYRVQKPAAKGASRKQSIGAAGLERMDANQLNIMPSYDDIQQKPFPTANGHMPSDAGIPPYAPIGMAPADGTFNPQPMMYPMFHPAVSGPMVNPQAPKPNVNGHAASTTNGSAEPNAPSSGGCCGGKAAASTPSPEQTSTTPAISNGTTEKVTPKSCCAPVPDSPEIKSQPELMPAPGMPPQSNGVMMAPFQTPVAMPNGMYSYFPQPTVFTYPPQYGSYLQPLQPEQWRHVMTALSFGQAIPYGMPGPMTFPVPSAPSTQNTDAGTSHQCSCGNSCQCVGCAAHPYNEATQDYVRSAWKTMAEEQTHTKGNHSIVKGKEEDATPVNGTSISNGGNTPSVNQADDAMSATAPQTPSDAASGTTEEEILSANDFFFVSYPFGDACAGETTSCPCGDDCQCIGCAIHNTPDQVEPVL